MTIEPKDIFVLRTPTLPINNILSNASNLIVHYTHLLADDFFKEAIYTASPELYQQAIKWLKGEITDPRKVQKLMLSLHRYYLRMCSRCTPYGLFAGFAIGTIGNSTALQIGHHNQHTKYSRLDMNYMAELVNAIQKITGVKKYLQYFSNNSLHTSGNKYRYITYQTANKKRQYEVASTLADVYIEKIWQKALDGATIDELIKTLENEEIASTVAALFIDELIENQVLVSELEPTITGEAFFNVLIQKCSAIAPLQFITEQLQKIDTLLKGNIDCVTAYQEVDKLVQTIVPHTTSKDLIQTDLFLHFDQITINEKDISNIICQVKTLLALSSTPKIDTIENFITQFKKRYEQQSIPLMDALDPEVGIGYDIFSGTATDHLPLIKNIDTNKSINDTSEKTVAWGKLQQFQHSKYIECIRHQLSTIEITDEDMAALASVHQQPKFPCSMYLMGSILNMPANNTALNNTPTQFSFLLKSIGGPSSANLLGRFCHGSTLLTEQLKDFLKEEESHFTDTIFAEIVHLPEARTGNILMRPVLRAYEIPYLAQSGVPAEMQLPVTDLYVSVINNEIVLTSKRLGKRVMPRLSTAHNTTGSTLPVYRFLTDLQFQGYSTPFHWQWGVLESSAFLPRVTYKNIILKRAQWVLKKKDHEVVEKNKLLNLVDYFSAITTKQSIPQYVAMVEGDNELLLDFKSEACLQILADSIMKKEKIVLVEFLGLPEHCVVKNKEGQSFTNEVIIPLSVQTNSSHTVSKVKAKANLVTTTDRQFITGSQWLYTKIYCGSKTAEHILTTIIKPITEDLLQSGTIEQWFFIRYNDEGGHHLRVRFCHTQLPHFWQAVLDILMKGLQTLIDTAQVHSLQTDIYQRELERYGEESIELSETIFYYDSEAVVHFIDLLEGGENEQYRWLFALRGIDMLLDDFEYTLPEKEQLLHTLQKSFFQEFEGNKNLTIQLNDSYRDKMQLISSILNPDNDATGEVEEAAAIFKARSEKIKPIAAELIRMQSRKTATLDTLLSNYIHMFLNRLFISNQRKHELVVYHFLAKYYKSKRVVN
jgi:lantibiotic biosynthesis protein